MKKSTVSRLALLSAAAVFIAACSSIEGPVSPMSPPDAPVFVGEPGVFAAGVVTACIDATSPNTTYSFSTTVANEQPGDDVTSPAPIAFPGQCADVVVRTDQDPDFAVATVTASITGSPAGVWSWTCASDSGAGCPDGAASIADDNSSRGGENHLHGTTITFHFEPDAITGTGCTYTLGRWKNKNSAITNAYVFYGLNALTVLKTAPKGNPYYILAHQYIAAKLNVDALASMDNGDPLTTTDDVLAAFQAATTYFGLASAAAPLPAGYTKAQITGWASTLDQYNNGLLGPGHCDEITPTV